MQTLTHIEDIFEQFYKLLIADVIPVQLQDQSACYSFYETIVAGNLLTENQQRYILKILDKYRLFCAAASLDYSEQLESPQWKNPVRIIDKSKKAWIEEDEENIFVCLKFPYQLKDVFEKEFEIDSRTSVWELERRVRKMSIYHINLLTLNEFLIKHHFEIEESFSIALAQYEEILNQQDQISPQFEIVDGNIKLINAAAGAEDWWKENRNHSLSSDILLAKAMGFKLIDSPKTVVEQIAASNTNQFWIEDNARFLDLVNEINGKVCVLIDRVSDAKEWLKSFIASSDAKGIDRNLIKVCFRESKAGNTGLNDWVKEQGLGGPVEEGKILIFQHKPAKWLFKDPQSVKILATNNLYPPTNGITKDWFATHSCVVYLGDIKPSKTRNTKIVQL